MMPFRPHLTILFGRRIQIKCPNFTVRNFQFSAQFFFFNFQLNFFDVHVTFPFSRYFSNLFFKPCMKKLVQDSKSIQYVIVYSLIKFLPAAKITFEIRIISLCTFRSREKRQAGINTNGFGGVDFSGFNPVSVGILSCELCSFFTRNSQSALHTST
jgi:hypothetical protein